MVTFSAYKKLIAAAAYTYNFLLDYCVGLVFYFTSILKQAALEADEILFYIT